MTAITMLILALKIPAVQGAVVDVRFAILAQAAQSNDIDTFNRSYATLYGAGQHCRLFDFVATQLERSERDVQHSLICRVSDFPYRATEVIPQLQRIVDNHRSHPMSRLAAVRMLGHISGDRLLPFWQRVARLTTRDPESVASEKRRTSVVLRCCLISEWPALQAEACVALWVIEHRSETIIPTLVALIDNPEGGKLDALDAIATIGPALKGSLGPIVVSMTHDDHPLVRIRVYRLLPEFAPTKQAAAEELARVLLDKTVTAANDAKKLRDDLDGNRITLEEYVMMSRIAGSEVNVIKQVLVSLGEVAIPNLIAILRQKENADARYAALNVLRLMKIAKKGDAAKLALDEVKKLLNDPDPSVKSLAETTVKELTSN